MNNSHPKRWSARLLRRITLLLVPPVLLLMFVTEMLVQFVELQNRNEVVSTSIVIALLSMSALSFGWNRSLADLGDREKLGPKIHYAGEGSLHSCAARPRGALFYLDQVASLDFDATGRPLSLCAPLVLSPARYDLCHAVRLGTLQGGDDRTG